MQIKWKFWIEKDEKHVMGKGGYEILKAIKECGSILRASKRLGMSYRFIWSYLKRMERVLGEEVVISKRGGAKGGETVLTPFGEELLRLYERFEKLMDSALRGLHGVVKDVKGRDVVVEISDSFDINVGDEVILIVFKSLKNY